MSDDDEGGRDVARQPGPCNAAGCKNPLTRLYPCGWRCADHRPGDPDGRDNHLGDPR